MSGDLKPRKPISDRSLSQEHAALMREGASFEFRMRWLLRVTEDWLPNETEPTPGLEPQSELTE